MTVFDYALDAPTTQNMGLVVLQTDETLEQDFRRMLPLNVSLYASRVPSGAEVTRESLAAMEGHLRGAASLLPPAVAFDVVGYGCTSGTAQIGADQIARRIKQGARTAEVTEPVSALIAACHAMDIRSLAFLSPYVAEVSGHLRQVLADRKISSPVFGSFDEGEEAKVAKISARSIHEAACDLARQRGADAIFLSCTNLRTLDVIEPLEADTGLPVLSSNQVLAWHMCQLAGQVQPAFGPGRLFRM
jgi:maleate isomerase